MSWYDRFTSKKGKEQKSVQPSVKIGAPKKLSAADQDKKAFGAVPTAPAKDIKESDKKPVAKTSAPVTSKDSTDRAYKLLLRPVITEKSTMLGKQNQYVFAIAPTATKIDIRQAVQHVYNVRPTAVAIVNLPGKDVRYGRYRGRTVARKKAIVTLPAGKTIDLTVS